MTWLVRGLLALAAAILALGGVLTMRTLAVSAPELPEVTLAAAPQIDAGATAERLAAALRFETISRRAGEYDAPPFDALHAFLRQSYPQAFAAMTVERPIGHSLLMTWPGADPKLAPMVLLAHQDVVPIEAGTEAAWSAPPFAGEIKDGYVIGRGALDDKAGVIGLLEAVEALLAEGFVPKRTIILAFGHDEEVSGAGAAAMAKLIAARGQAWFVLDEGMAILTKFPVTGGPAAAIGIAEKGYLTVRLTARDAGGHSSTPPKLTAAEKVAAALMAIDAKGFPGGLESGPANLMLKTLAPDMPFAQRLAIANLWLFGPIVQAQFEQSPQAAAVLATTVAPTILGGGTKDNILPQEAWAIVNLRLHPRDDVQSALARLRAAAAEIPDVTIEIEGAASEPSPVSSIASDSYALIAAAAASAAPEGAPVVPMLVLGATDARHYRDAAENVYRFSPMALEEADIASIHGTNERISVENVGRMATAYARLIKTGAQ